jgi:hypothetical protein
MTGENKLVSSRYESVINRFGSQLVGRGEVEKVNRGVGALRLGLGLGLIWAVGALAFPGVATALSPHPFLGSFCEPEGLGTAPCEPSFGVPGGIVVDPATGDLLVIDLADQTLSRFDANGEPAPFSALAGNVIDGHPGEEDATPEEEILSTEPGGLQEAQVAVAPPGAAGGTEGDIYVTNAFEHERVDIFESTGKYIGQISAGYSCGVAVDPSGAVYVGDYFFGVHKLVPTAPATFGPPSNFPFPETCQVVASEGFVFPVAFSGPVAKLDSTTGEVKYTVASGENRGVALDPGTGNLYVASDSSVNEYDISGTTEAELLSNISPGGAKVTGVAARGSEEVYIARAGNPQIEVWGAAETLPKVTTEAADSVGTTNATLKGTVNPEGAPLSECTFEWGETAAYGKVAPCEEPDAEEVGEGSAPVPVHADLSDLEVGTGYHFRLLATNVNGSVPGGDASFRTLGASIKDQSASLVATTSARLNAEVNPNGEATSYTFEYVSETQFEKGGGYAEAVSLPDPPGNAGSGTQFVEVGQQLTGLQPDTVYHFRLTATTPVATHLGFDQTFTTTFAPGAATLPDGRVYEMVSPPQKVGEVFPPEPNAGWTGTCRNCLPGLNDAQMPRQVSVDGGEVVYEGSPFTGGLASGPNEYRSTRGASGWETESLSTPSFSRAEEQGYKAFAADLGRAIVYQVEPALSPQAPVRGGKSFANLYLREETGVLQPLVVDEPPQREADRQSDDRFKIGFAGANAGTAFEPALGHVIFEANDALTEDVPGVAPAAPAIEAGERNLYEWVGGELRLVNVAPGNATAVAGTIFGSGRQLTGEAEGSGADFDGAISADGSRIFWSEKTSGQVYVRIDGEETREIDDPGRFLVASADGSRLLLSDGCLYQLEAEECEADLSEGQGGFEGILGAAEDLSRVYFVDTEALVPPTEENDNGEHAEDAELNLYDWEEGATSFIGILDSGDNEFNGILEPQVGDWMPSASSRTAQVTPDGSFLVFMSRAPLTGYDNHVRGGSECRAKEPAACFEVFEYRGESGELLCASCNPSGERPLGGANLSLIYRGGTLVALSGYPQPGNLTPNDGRLFFESEDALSLADTNGRIKDVYQWEPEGVGSCERAGGCIALISSGQSPNDSMFLNATPSGDDAFFVTRERLLPQDEDEKLDLYDARVEGGFEEAPTPPCGPEPCRAPSPAPPSVQGPPASGEFQGSGNVHPKKKQKKKKHKKHRKRSAKHKRGGGR